MDSRILKKAKKARIVSTFLILMLTFTGFAFAANTGSSSDSAADAKSKTTEIEKAKKDLYDAEIILSKYHVFATGKDVKPKVKKVTVNNGKRVVPKDEYTVKFYDANGQRVKSIEKIGDYTVVVKAKKSGNYEGNCSLTFTVLGKPQNLTISSTTIKLQAPGQKKYDEEKYEHDLSSIKNEIQKIMTEQIENQIREQLKESEIELSDIAKTLLAGEPVGGTFADTYYELGLKYDFKLDKEAYRLHDFTLTPEADGDGTGFSYSSSDKKVVTVDKEGNLYPNEIGKAEITIKTEGNMIYQPAKIKVFITVE